MHERDGAFGGRELHLGGSRIDRATPPAATTDTLESIEAPASAKPRRSRSRRDLAKAIGDLRATMHACYAHEYDETIDNDSPSYDGDADEAKHRRLDDRFDKALRRLESLVATIHGELDGDAIEAVGVETEEDDIVVAISAYLAREISEGSVRTIIVSKSNIAHWTATEAK